VSLTGKENFAASTNAAPANGDVWFDGTNLQMQIGGAVYVFVMGPGPPTVLSISPTSGASGGGTSVTITGTNFAGATGATIGGIALMGFTVVNSTTVSGTTQGGPAGAQNVVVTTAVGAGTGVGLYTYAFDPTGLFVGGYTGGWWDPSDHTTTFQDTAGTIPANTAGQTVKRINDKSGNGNNLTGSVGCTLQSGSGLWWLAFNGTTNNLAATFTMIQPTVRIMAMQTPSITVSSAGIFDGGAMNSNLLQEVPPSPNIQMYAFAFLGPNTHRTLGVNHVTLEVFNGTSSSLQVDNTAALIGNASTVNAGGLTVASQGGGGSNSNLQWFGGVNIGRLLTTTETNESRTFFGAKAGLVL
jgi:hypothetical protein